MPIAFYLCTLEPVQDSGQHTLLGFEHSDAPFVDANTGGICNWVCNCKYLPYQRRKDYCHRQNGYSASASTRHLICWTRNSWNPIGLTSLTLDTTRLSNKPDLDDIYKALVTTCRTIQRFEYVSLVACIDAGVNGPVWFFLYSVLSLSPPMMTWFPFSDLWSSPLWTLWFYCVSAYPNSPFLRTSWYRWVYPRPYQPYLWSGWSI